MMRSTPAIDASTRRYLNSPQIAREYDTYFALNPLFGYDTQVLQRWLSSPGRLVDLGCGSGRHVLAFAEAGFEVTGVDLSSHMLEVASEKLRERRLRARLVRADLTSLAGRFEPGSFDYALCMFSTLGLIAGGGNRLSALRVWRDLLVPRGLLALHVHNRWHNLYSTEGVSFLLGNAMRTLMRRSEWGDKRIAWYRGVRKLYIHVFTRAELTRLLNAAGFDVVDVVRLNERRDGPAPYTVLADWRANGFLVLARVSTPMKGCEVG